MNLKKNDSYKYLSTPSISSVDVPSEMLPIVGSIDPNGIARSYSQTGPFEEMSLWYDAITEYFGSMITPGEVWMYCPVTRDAVYKAIEKGSLTSFSYEVEGYRADSWEKKKRHKKEKLIYVPLVEVRNWRSSIEKRHLSLGKISKEASVISNFPKEYQKYWEWYLANNNPPVHPVTSSVKEESDMLHFSQFVTTRIV